MDVTKVKHSIKRLSRDEKAKVSVRRSSDDLMMMIEKEIIRTKIVKYNKIDEHVKNINYLDCQPGTNVKLDIQNKLQCV